MAQAPPPTVPPLRENTRENIHFWSFWFTSGVPVVVTNDSQATVPVLIGMETTQNIFTPLTFHLGVRFRGQNI